MLSKRKYSGSGRDEQARAANTFLVDYEELLESFTKRLKISSAKYSSVANSPIKTV